MKHSSSDGRTLVAHVPVEGTTTPYTYLGDFFAWLCLIALGAMGVISIPVYGAVRK